MSDRAVLPFDRFPSISELYEIAYELRREAEIRANSERIENTRREWEQNGDT